MVELIKRLKDHKIERIAFERGITAEETSAFMHAVAALGKGEATEPAWAFPHIRVGRITAEEKPIGWHRRRHGRHPPALFECRRGR